MCMWGVGNRINSDAGPKVSLIITIKETLNWMCGYFNGGGVFALKDPDKIIRCQSMWAGGGGGG